MLCIYLNIDNNQHVQEDFEKLNGIRKFANKDPLTLVGPEILLDSITPITKLYVVAHANLGAGLGESIRFPSQLADELEEIGLPKSFKDLRVFSCNSGIYYPDVPGSKIQKKSYACELLIEMRKRGYNELEVSGYSGWLSVGQFPSASKVSQTLYHIDSNKPDDFKIIGIKHRASHMRKTYFVTDDGKLKYKRPYPKKFELPKEDKVL